VELCGAAPDPTSLDASFPGSHRVPTPAACCGLLLPPRRPFALPPCGGAEPTYNRAGHGLKTIIGEYKQPKIAHPRNPPGPWDRLARDWPWAVEAARGNRSPGRAMILWEKGPWPGRPRALAGPAYFPFFLPPPFDLFHSPVRMTFPGGRASKEALQPDQQPPPFANETATFPAPSFTIPAARLRPGEGRLFATRRNMGTAKNNRPVGVPGPAHALKCSPFRYRGRKRSSTALPSHFFAVFVAGQPTLRAAPPGRGPLGRLANDGAAAPFLPQIAGPGGRVPAIGEKIRS